MTRTSDFASVSQDHTFSIQVEDESGERSTVLVGMTAKTRDGSDMAVRFDRDGLAYMKKPGGSNLLHVRAPQHDLDQGETVTVKTTEPVESYFPVLVYDQGDLGGEPVGQAQVRFTGHDGERRLLSDEYGHRYAARPDNKPGVIALEDPAADPAPVQPTKSRKGAKARTSS